MAYWLKFLLVLERLYLVFNIVKLTTIPKNSISSRCLKPLSNPIVRVENSKLNCFYYYYYYLFLHLFYNLD